MAEVPTASVTAIGPKRLPAMTRLATNDASWDATNGTTVDPMTTVDGTGGAVGGAGGANTRRVTVGADEGLVEGPTASAVPSPVFYGVLLKQSRHAWSFAFSGPSIAILPVFSALVTTPFVTDFSKTMHTVKVVVRTVVWTGVAP